jgi:chromosome segregation ATPase
VEPSSLEDYERLLVETKVAAANAESERERLEYQVQSLRKRVLELETALDATREAYEALKLKSLRLSDEVETLQRRNRALELRLYDLDGEWNRGRNIQREGTSKATGL